MLHSAFFYLLILLPGAMALLALAFRWSSLAYPGLFGVTAFLALYGLQVIVRWLTRFGLHNFLPIDGIAKSQSAADPPLTFLLSYYGLEVLLLVILGTGLLLWLANALAKP